MQKGGRHESFDVLEDDIVVLDTPEDLTGLSLRNVPVRFLLLN